jgi:hypothetical protein
MERSLEKDQSSLRDGALMRFTIPGHKWPGYHQTPLRGEEKTLRSVWRQGRAQGDGEYNGSTRTTKVAMFASLPLTHRPGFDAFAAERRLKVAGPFKARKGRPARESRRGATPDDLRRHTTLINRRSATADAFRDSLRALKGPATVVTPLRGGLE